MYGHYLMTQWHAQATTYLLLPLITYNYLNTKSEHIADESMRKYLDDIKDGLSKIKPTVWDNMQRKVSILISTTSTVADFQVTKKVLPKIHFFFLD
jgi:hypothetical protein